MQIAEYIYDKDTDELDKNRRNAVLRIYSVISRKGSRLSELSDKKYIYREDSLWNLSPKGVSLSFTLYEENEIKHYLDFNKLYFANIIKLIKKKPIINALLSTKKGRQLIGEKLNILEQKMSPDFLEQFGLKIRESTIDMASKGVDIDAMDITEFEALLGTSLSSWILRR
ncbi:MAG: hypothetical protein H3Z52_12465 [archaeon]|nr:hypothetical protein [archaeon]